MNRRVSNIYFWIGLIGVALTAAGIAPDTLTSWEILFRNLIGILSNPFMLGSVAMAIVGVFVDTSTPGIKDKDVK